MLIGKENLSAFIWDHNRFSTVYTFWDMLTNVTPPPIAILNQISEISEICKKIFFGEHFCMMKLFWRWIKVWWSFIMISLSFAPSISCWILTYSRWLTIWPFRIKNEEKQENSKSIWHRALILVSNTMFSGSRNSIKCVWKSLTLYITFFNYDLKI